MASFEHTRSPRWEDETNGVVVRAPQPHEGVRRALLASFSAPPMPAEFIRLLNRLC